MTRDLWRDRFPDTRRYSWFRNAHNSASCIDFFLINTGLSGMVTGVDYGYGCRMDHSLVSMAIDIETFK